MSWNWTNACQEAFNLLKQAFTTMLCLWHFNLALHPIIRSVYVIAGIFSLCDDEGKVKPVAFYNHTLNGAKLNYDTHDKELLAIFEAPGWVNQKVLSFLIACEYPGCLPCFGENY